MSRGVNTATATNVVVEASVLSGNDVLAQPPSSSSPPVPIVSIMTPTVAPPTEGIKVAFQPTNSVNGFPTWAIILITILGSALVFTILGAFLHRAGKNFRTARAKRDLIEKQRLLL